MYALPLCRLHTSSLLMPFRCAKAFVETLLYSLTISAFADAASAVVEGPDGRRVNAGKYVVHIHDLSPFVKDCIGEGCHAGNPPRVASGGKLGQVVFRTCGEVDDARQVVSRK